MEEKVQIFVCLFAARCAEKKSVQNLLLGARLFQFWAIFRGNFINTNLYSKNENYTNFNRNIFTCETIFALQKAFSAHFLVFSAPSGPKFGPDGAENTQQTLKKFRFLALACRK